MNRPPEQSPGGGYAGRGTALALSRRTALAPEMGGDFAAADRLDQTLHLRDLVRIFLKQLVRHRALPFAPKGESEEDEMLGPLNRRRSMADYFHEG